MTDLSREELRAHLSAVEAQVRAALRIIAAESKSVQQAHGALRADLSAALVRLQSDLNSGQTEIQTKMDRTLAELEALGRTRKLTTAILTTLVLIFGIMVGVVAGGSWFFLQQSADGRIGLTAPAASAAAPAAAPAQSGSGSGTETAAQPPQSGFILENQSN